MDTLQPSPRVLEDTFLRAVSLLRATGTNKTIYRILSAHGFTPEEQKRGWGFVLTASNYGKPVTESAIDKRVRNAMVELDSTDERFFTLLKAAWRRDFPDQLEFVLQGELGPSTGASAVVGMATALARIKQLQSSAERKKTHKQDQAALAKLATKGITSQELERLASLVEIAQSTPEAMETPSDEAAGNAERANALLELHGWYTEWADTARAVITRRDHLISLGLAKRKKPAKPAEPENPPAPPK